MLIRLSLSAVSALFFLVLTTSVEGGTPQQTGRPLSSTPTYTEVHLKHIQRLIHEGRYGEAERAARTRLAVVEKESGPATPATAEVLNLLVEALWRGGHAAQQESLELARRALTIRLNKMGPLHSQVAESLAQLGEVHRERGEYVAAEEYYKRSLATFEQSLGDDDPRIADVLCGLSDVYRRKHELDEAKVLMERALTIYEESFGPEHAATGKALMGLANVVADMGDLEQTAISLYRRSVAVRERALGLEHPDVAVSLHNLAFQLYWEGEYDEARRIFERTVRIQEERLGPDHPALGFTLVYLGLLITDLGDLDQAERCFERGFKIHDGSLTATHPELAETLLRYGAFLNLRGRYSEARTMLERALEIFEVSLGLDNPFVAEALSRIADQASMIGDFPRAETLFQRALQINRAAFGRDVVNERSVIRGDHLSRLGRCVEAIEIFEKYVASIEGTSGGDHPELARELHKLASLYHQTGDITNAEQLYRRTLSIRARVSRPDHPDVAQSLIGLARVMADRGDLSESERLCGQGLQVLKNALGEEHPLVASALQDLARVLVWQGDLAGAFRAALGAERISREHLRITSRCLAEREALRYASIRASSLDLLLSLALREQTPERITRSLDAVIRSRAVVLDEMGERHRWTTSDQDLEILRLADELASAKTKLAHLAVRGPKTEDPHLYRARLDEVRGRKEDLERTLATRSQSHREGLRRANVGVEAVLASLPAGAAIVGFSRFEYHGGPGGREGEGHTETLGSYVAFVLTADNSGASIVNLGSARVIEESVSHVRDRLAAMASAPNRSLKRSESTYRETAGLLRSLVWDPIEEHLGEAEVVFVVPDGDLNLVNLAALPVGESSYLIEQGQQVWYLSAERDLTIEHQHPTGNGLLVLGDPAFDDPNLFAALGPAGEPLHIGDAIRPAVASAFRGLRSSCGDFQSLRFDDLPSSAVEVGEVAELWAGRRRLRGAGHGGEEVVVLKGPGASEGALKAMAVGRRALHLATHGFFLGGSCRWALENEYASETPAVVEDNPLLLSGLALAGANHRDAAGPDEEDGILTAEEIASLDLTGVEWAVLSACDTGVGEVRAGEGVFGLRRAFQIAGARTLIMSLWPVEDEASREWMKRLYVNRFVDDLSTADSVHRTSLELLQQRREEGKSTHPFYWAGFVAAGDWR